jgi:hypothetical protein
MLVAYTKEGQMDRVNPAIHVLPEAGSDQPPTSHGTAVLPTASVHTSLGLVEGDVLLYLDQRGATPMRRIIRDLEWPSPMVTMAIGALIREDLVSATQHELELIITPVRPHGPQDLVAEPVPEVWGG